MLFTSPAFLFLFLPAFLVIFRIVSRRHLLTATTKLVIIGGTYLFYSFENVGYLLPFVFATVMDLIWSVALKHTENPKLRKLIVAGSVIQNVGLLAIFKYLNWIAASFPQALWIQDFKNVFADTNGHIALPPGISFYLFESLSFVIDCYRRKIDTPKDPLDFLTFISMFPRFIAGPIVRYADLQDSIRDYKGPRWSDGLFVFAIGFVLKILLADSFGSITDQLFGRSFTFFGAWLSALAYTFQLYIDFSAYSLMAIGLGLVLGFPFKDNFREPYFSSSITEFWRRWHISLSTWLRDYLYIPLGGNRVSPARARLNLFLTMLLGGIWHGANSTFVIWGAYHGLLLVGERELRVRGIEVKSRILTFVLVAIGWVYFRAKNPHEGERMLNAMLGFNGWGWLDAVKALQFDPTHAALAGLGLVWVFHLEPRVRIARENKDWSELSIDRTSWTWIVVVAALFLVAQFFILANRNIPFLYFQF